MKLEVKKMNIPYFKLFTILFVMACMMGVGSAADGDASRGDPSAANFSIDEPNSQTFNATIANADPTNKTFSVGIKIVYWCKHHLLIT
jgi:hypothetical protein